MLSTLLHRKTQTNQIQKLITMKKYYLLIISVMVICQTVMTGQTNKEANGLLHAQSKAELPIGRHIAPEPARKQFVDARSILTYVSDNEYLISGGWYLTSLDNAILNGNIFSKEYDYSSWYNATVPGTVLTTLVEQGVYNDPYYGLNNLSIPDSLCRMEWCYRTAFIMPDKEAGKRYTLDFDGINYKATIYLNGERLGNIAGAFRRGSFDISDILDFGEENVLVVRITPPANPGVPHEQSGRTGFGPNGGLMCMDGPTFIASEGWDWMPGIRDRNIGIWQDVKIKIDGGARIRDPHVITEALDQDNYSYAGLRLRVDVESALDNMPVTIKGEYSEGAFEKELTLTKGHNDISLGYHEFNALSVRNPRLWWPNGYGNPDLYDMKLSLTDKDGRIIDSQDIRFGIRTCTYEFAVDTASSSPARIEYDPMLTDLIIIDNTKLRAVEQGVVIPSLEEGSGLSSLKYCPDEKMGPYLIIKVNGVRIFCRGGNWGMDDAMKRVSEKHLIPAFELHRRAGLNIVRNWTGETTEELFYSLCDEYGMMVWNDFWSSTENANRTPVDEDLFLDNVRDVVRRFRNHPSIVIWCPRNEGFASPYLDKGIASIVLKEDGTRHYHGNSRSLNMKMSGKWSHFRDKNEYFNVRGHGFNSEIGAPAVPTAESVRKFIPEEDLWPISDTWFYHDYPLIDNGKFNVHMVEVYGEPESLEDYCAKAQFMNYDSYRAIMEGYNAHMWDNASGAMYWMSHPAWPSVVWQLYSWDYETPASYFGARKSCEPVHVQWNNNDHNVVVINATLQDMENMSVEGYVYGLDGSLFDKREKAHCNLKGNTKKELYVYDYPSECQKAHILRLVLKDNRDRVISINDYLRPGTTERNLLSMKETEATIRIKKSAGSNGEFRIRISNSSPTPAFGVKLNAMDRDHNIILPAYFSDGYFNLLPGEARDITLDMPYRSGMLVRVSGYNVKTIIE